MRILQVSTADLAGGAEAIAWQLFQAYRQQGHESYLAVGSRRTGDPHVLPMQPGPDGLWGQTWETMSQIAKGWTGRVRGMGRLSQSLAAESWRYPRRWLQQELGYETYPSNASWRLLQLLPDRPDVIHAHNLHGPVDDMGQYRGYFDLAALPTLSQQVPFCLTLHDAWLLSGHCAHSFDCDRWLTGCGQCPDLSIYPAIKRDATAANWQRKQAIYRRSRLYIATPSAWLMHKVKASMLAPAIVESRVIPNGVDLNRFCPADQLATRRSLNLPETARILLLTANGIRQNIWKDYQTIRAALDRMATRMQGQSILFLALGEDAPPEQIGSATVQFVPYQRDPNLVARYYQAADVYLHAAKADTFPTTVLEAMACGLPVVATAVGGIPEQVEDGKTGFLVPVGDAVAMADQTQRILEDLALQQQFSLAATIAVRQRFDQNIMVQQYLNWYAEICSREAAHVN